MENFKIDSETEILFDNDDWDVKLNGLTQNDSFKSLYKYFSLTEYSLDGLENNYIYLSNPKDFNDPFDCNRNLILEKQRKIKDWNYIESLNNISEIGITSFSEDGLEPLLWSHYANSYRGFCLKFKPEFLREINTELIKLKKVIYSKCPNSISINSNFAKYYQFILKLDNWSYEKEWRLLFKNPSVISNKYHFDEKSIDEISIGYKFLDPRNESERKLKEQFEKLRKGKFKNIPLYTVGPHDTKLELKKTLLIEGTVEDALEMIGRRFK